MDSYPSSEIVLTISTAVSPHSGIRTAFRLLLSCGDGGGIYSVELSEEGRTLLLEDVARDEARARFIYCALVSGGVSLSCAAEITEELLELSRDHPHGTAL